MVGGWETACMTRVVVVVMLVVVVVVVWWGGVGGGVGACLHGSAQFHLGHLRHLCRGMLGLWFMV